MRYTSQRSGWCHVFEPALAVLVVSLSSWWIGIAYNLLIVAVLKSKGSEG